MSRRGQRVLNSLFDTPHTAELPVKGHSLVFNAMRIPQAATDRLLEQLGPPAPFGDATTLLEVIFFSSHMVLMFLW